MDTSQFMIIDTTLEAPAKFITSRVSSIFKKDNKWYIKFESTRRMYGYRQERILYFENPEKIDLDGKGFYLYNRAVSDIKKIIKFGDICHVFYHVVFNHGIEADFSERELYISRTTLDECGGDKLKYLNKLAEETGIVTDSGINILKTQYDWIDRYRMNVPLAQYIGYEEKLSVYDVPNTVIYPFSCNASQKQGVENAITNQLSIIQGPPGTGKTQTILNIIANVLLHNKTVLVVSNNNSAVENVAEKLSSDKIGLGFLIAKLGKKDNKEAFIANQPVIPDMSEWKQKRISKLESDVRSLLKVVSRGFEIQNKYAELNTELQALKTEKKYNSIEFKEYISLFDNLISHADSEQVLLLKFDIEKFLEKHDRLRFWFILKWMFKAGFKIRKLLKQPTNDVIRILESHFYETRFNELNERISEYKKELDAIDVKGNLDRLSSISMTLLKHRIVSCRKERERKVFKYEDIKLHSQEFLSEYPIVLSTTYSCKNCISKNMVFDYIIMDEASQIDITTGALALSCATNAVIVGDDKQLPNVIDSRMMQALNVLEDKYSADDKFRSSTHSFLQSCCEVFKDAPQTLLREHYRCHPKIIEFCNKLFYDGELITMTKDNDEENVISIIRTPIGQHARGHYNQREIDVIKNEILTRFEGSDSVGIISPYRNQAECINKEISSDIASTVHKYQGRECDSIIMSMVDNNMTSFSDDPNLLNVAVSRAKSQLYVVVTGNEISSDTNVGQLIAYAQYNNFEIKQSRVHSVFDILYKQYSEERLNFERSKRKDLGELSENLIYDLLYRCFAIKNYRNIDVLCHYPLYRLVCSSDNLTLEEKDFIDSTLSHVDFLLYNTITKQPLLCIEVDGWKYHNTDVQKKRDEIKDRILDKYNLKHIRLSTVDTVNEDTICSLLENVSLKTMI